MRIHDAANIFPPMSEREFAELVADMGEHGQREPIVTVDGAIVDGRHRARACEALGLEPVVREWEGPGSLTAYVVSMNLHRRHMDESQRAMVAERLRRMPSANLHPDSDTAEQAADLLNVSRRSVFTAAKVLDKGAPELVAAVDAGQVAVSTAALVAGLPVEKDLACDFIAYAWLPTRRCVLLPFLPLRAAWREHFFDWITSYKEIRGGNRGYTTISVGVPTDVLLSAMNDAMSIRWGA